MPHTMPAVLPLAETEGTGPEKLNACVLTEVGVVETRPLLPALNENALMGSASPVLSLPPPQYRLPFQYAGAPHMPEKTPVISCTICGSALVQAGTWSRQ